MQLLFIHGAGGYVDDRETVERLRSTLPGSVEMPPMPDEDMSVEAWAERVRRPLARLGADDAVIGHSFGATVLQWVLAEEAWAPRRALLLAAPDWSPAGWDVAEYVHHGPEPGMEVSLHHCRDDDVVPFDHLALNRPVAVGAGVGAPDRRPPVRRTRGGRRRRRAACRPPLTSSGRPGSRRDRCRSDCLG